MTIKAHVYHSVNFWVLWQIVPWLKKPSGSTDLGLIVIKAWNHFSRLFDIFFVASKKLISFITICDRISSCAGIVLWSSLSRITWILCFDFKWLNFQCLNLLLLYNGTQIALWCWLSLVVLEMPLKLLIFFGY